MRNHLTSLFLSLITPSGFAPDPERLRLEAESAKWFRGVWICGVAVAIGCALEVWETCITLISWRRHKRKLPPLKENPGSWRIPMAALGLLLVIGGVAGETIFEVLVSNSDAAIRAHESDVLTRAETREADLQQQLIAQGPRWSLLYGKTADEFIAALKPFAGQRAEIRYSRFHFPDNDMMQVAMRLQFLLGESGAGWSVFPFPLPSNMNGSEVWVSVRPKAPQSTLDAATKLLQALRKIPLKVNDRPDVTNDLRSADVESKRYFWNDKEIKLPPLTPDTIVVTVCPHP